MQFVEFYEKYNTKYSIRFVGDPSSRDFVWLQEYYTNYAVFSTTKLYPYCRCLTTMRKSYQKMAGLTDEESWALKRLGDVYTEELNMPEKAIPYLDRKINVCG